MHCTNFAKNNGTHLRGTDVQWMSRLDIGKSLSVPRGGSTFHTAKQRHQIRNLNVIFDLAARPLVGAASRESVELFD